MVEQPKVYVNNLTFSLQTLGDVSSQFLEYIHRFDVDLDPENDKDFEIFGQEIFTPSVEQISGNSIELRFVTKEKPLDQEGFILLPVHYEGAITTMIMDYESNDEHAGVYMWFGDKPIFLEINRAYFVLKRIDALRITEAPESYDELALMIEEPIKVVKYVLEQSDVTLEQLPYINFRPKIRNNAFFKKVG